ncbi:hypothetical protein ACH5RR_023380 [Cinchona calisaya]|uniref:COP1-interacting protein 7 n=1 Tax=Cinchona calisaya TaxID=153742 RepID=A0ABD2ZAJ5_9GENT
MAALQSVTGEQPHFYALKSFANVVTGWLLKDRELWLIKFKRRRKTHEWKRRENLSDDGDDDMNQPIGELRDVENEADIKRKAGEESNKKMRFLTPEGQVKQYSTTFRPGSEDVGQPRKNESVDRHENAAKLCNSKAVADQKKGSKLRGKESNLIKIKRAIEAIDMPPKFAGATFSDWVEPVSAPNTRSPGKKSTEGRTTGVRINTELPASRANNLSSLPAAEIRHGALADINDDDSRTPVSNSQKKSKPLLKLKFKNPFSVNQSS